LNQLCEDTFDTLLKIVVLYQQCISSSAMDDLKGTLAMMEMLDAILLHSIGRMLHTSIGNLGAHTLTPYATFKSLISSIEKQIEMNNVECIRVKMDFY